MRNKGGRPTKLTPKLQEEICKAIRAGNYIETAAAFAGISKSTLYEWLKRGAREKERLAKNPRAKIKKSEAPFVEFSDAVEKALAASEVRDVMLIGKAAETQWQAAAWRLERRFPERWGRREKLALEHTGKDGGPIESVNIHRIDLSRLTDEELETLENIVDKLADEGGNQTRMGTSEADSLYDLHEEELSS